MTLKPVVIIAIIFSITIVLAGIGIAVMDSTVDNSQVAPAQQMNVESEVDEEEKSEYEATGDTIADDKVVEPTTADESAYYGVPNTNPLLTDKMKKTLDEKMWVTLGPFDGTFCEPIKRGQYDGIKTPSGYPTPETEEEWGKRMLHHMTECKHGHGKISQQDHYRPSPMTQEERNEFELSERLRVAENFPVVVPNDEYTSHPFILEVREKKKNNVEQKDLENTVAIIITGQLQDKGYTTFTLEGVFQRSSMNMVLDGYDPLYLTQGNLVNVIPLDYGFKNNNRYTLTAINGDYSTSITWTPLP